MYRRGGASFLLVLSLLLGGCIFGGGDDTPPTQARQTNIPTATPPANLPEPLVLSSDGGGALPPSTGGGATGTYTVRSGDTLLAIAAAQGVPAADQAAWVAEVVRLNNLASAAALTVGQELRLPASSAAGTPAAGATPARTSTPTTGSTPGATATRPATTPAAGTTTPTAGATPGATTTGGGTYTVVAGDFPLLIAQKLNVPEAQQAAWAAQLVTLNNINPSALVVGQVLQLPANTPR